MKLGLKMLWKGYNRQTEDADAAVRNYRRDVSGKS